MSGAEGICILVMSEESDFLKEGMGRIPAPDVIRRLGENGVSMCLIGVSVLPSCPPEEKKELIVRLRNKIKSDLSSAGLTAMICDPCGPAETEEKTPDAGRRSGFSGRAAELMFVLGYDGRTELAHILRKMKTEKEDGKKNADSITEEDVGRHAAIPFIPDLVVCCGSSSLPEIMIWQTTYSELYFSEKTFSDMDPEDLFKALRAYNDRKRRYGR